MGAGGAPWPWLAGIFATGFFAVLLAIVKAWLDGRRSGEPKHESPSWPNERQLMLHRLSELERDVSLLQEDQRQRRDDIHGLKARIYLLRKGIRDGVLDWPEGEE